MAFLTYKDISAELNGADENFVSLVLDEVQAELNNFGLSFDNTTGTKYFSPDGEFGSSSFYVGNVWDITEISVVKACDKTNARILGTSEYFKNENLNTGAVNDIYLCGWTLCRPYQLKITGTWGWNIDWSQNENLKKAIISYIKYRQSNKPNIGAIKSARTGDSSVTFETGSTKSSSFSDTIYFKKFANYL